MKIRISKKHIEEGKCKDSQKCMIAAAIKAADSTVSYVSVKTNGITITKRKSDGGAGVRQRWAVPTAAARKIIQFDSGENVTPFAFEPLLIKETILSEVTKEQRKKNTEKRVKRRAARAANGLPKEDVYGRRSRIAGV